ncbi:MAG: hypothetical protein MK033_06775 [Candidatus Caenarcaniphilales bacterium]|nr:hypothetical protein [Candidatus Caenarcaniphilales bacterium]
MWVYNKDPETGSRDYLLEDDIEFKENRKRLEDSGLKFDKKIGSDSIGTSYFLGSVKWEDYSSYSYLDYCRGNCYYYHLIYLFFRGFKRLFLDEKKIMAHNYIYWVMYDRSEQNDYYWMINNLAKDGRIYVFKGWDGYYPDKEEVPSHFKIINNDKCEYVSAHLCPEWEYKYNGHEKTLERFLCDSIKSFSRGINYFTYKPGHIVKKVVNCFDENKDEVPKHTFFYESPFWQDMLKDADFFREYADKLYAAESKVKDPKSDLKIDESLPKDLDLNIDYEIFIDGKSVGQSLGYYCSKENWNADGNYIIKILSTREGKYEVKFLDFSDGYDEHKILVQKLVGLNELKTRDETKFGRHIHIPAIGLPGSYYSGDLDLGVLNLEYERARNTVVRVSYVK